MKQGLIVFLWLSLACGTGCAPRIFVRAAAQALNANQLHTQPISWWKGCGWGTEERADSKAQVRPEKEAGRLKVAISSHTDQKVGAEA